MGYVGDLKLLERIQRRWTRVISGLEGMQYGDLLRRLNLFSFQGRMLRADLILVWKIFHGYSAIEPSDIFVPPQLDTTRGHPFKIAVQRCRLDVRKSFLSVRVVQGWNSLAPETVMASTLDTFKSLLHCEIAEELFVYS